MPMSIKPNSLSSSREIWQLCKWVWVQFTTKHLWSLWLCLSLEYEHVDNSDTSAIKLSGRNAELMLLQSQFTADHHLNYPICFTDKAPPSNCLNHMDRWRIGFYLYEGISDPIFYLDSLKALWLTMCCVISCSFPVLVDNDLGPSTQVLVDFKCLNLPKFVLLCNFTKYVVQSPFDL
jgi:hypothetical protein